MNTLFSRVGGFSKSKKLKSSRSQTEQQIVCSLKLHKKNQGKGVISIWTVLCANQLHNLQTKLIDGKEIVDHQQIKLAELPNSTFINKSVMRRFSLSESTQTYWLATSEQIPRSLLKWAFRLKWEARTRVSAASRGLCHPSRVQVFGEMNGWDGLTNMSSSIDMGNNAGKFENSWHRQKLRGIKPTNQQLRNSFWDWARIAMRHREDSVIMERLESPMIQRTNQIKSQFFSIGGKRAISNRQNRLCRIAEEIQKNCHDVSVSSRSRTVRGISTLEEYFSFQKAFRCSLWRLAKESTHPLVMFFLNLSLHSRNNSVFVHRQIVSSRPWEICRASELRALDCSVTDFKSTCNKP
jgi:hypothetical protein